MIQDRNLLTWNIWKNKKEKVQSQLSKVEEGFKVLFSHDLEQLTSGDRGYFNLEQLPNGRVRADYFNPYDEYWAEEEYLNVHPDDSSNWCGLQKTYSSLNNFLNEMDLYPNACIYPKVKSFIREQPYPALLYIGNEYKYYPYYVCNNNFVCHHEYIGSDDSDFWLLYITENNKYEIYYNDKDLAYIKQNNFLVREIPWSKGKYGLAEKALRICQEIEAKFEI